MVKESCCLCSCAFDIEPESRVICVSMFRDFSWWLSLGELLLSLGSLDLMKLVLG